MLVAAPCCLSVGPWTCAINVGRSLMSANVGGLGGVLGGVFSSNLAVSGGDEGMFDLTIGVRLVLAL